MGHLFTVSYTIYRSVFPSDGRPTKTVKVISLFIIVMFSHGYKRLLVYFKLIRILDQIEFPIVTMFLLAGSLTLSLSPLSPSLLN